MSATHKPFREIVKPGSNFEFVGRTKTWTTLSLLLIVASIAMLFVNKHVISGRGSYLNWTTDFTGGTEVIFKFVDKADDNKVVDVDQAKVRKVLAAAGYDGYELARFEWEGIEGLVVRTKDFGALKTDVATNLRNEFIAEFSTFCKTLPDAPQDCGVVRSHWTGDRLNTITNVPVPTTFAAKFFTDRGQEMKPWSPLREKESKKELAGTGEYSVDIDIYGLDRQFAKLLTEKLDGVQAKVVDIYSVSAKEGSRLRNDGIKALFYAMLLIVLYLAVRFDIRYCPGAIIALLHDATLVVGVFAATYADVSLTTVAALLTVIGYSVNDTVVIFDRIRENVAKLKDKGLERVVNISLNETLARTLLTSITLFVVTIMMNIFGTGLVRNFAFAMNIGVVVGVYSSIFIASPVFLYMDRRFYPPKGPVKGEGKNR